MTDRNKCIAIITAYPEALAALEDVVASAGRRYRWVTKKEG